MKSKVASCIGHGERTRTVFTPEVITAVVPSLITLDPSLALTMDPGGTLMSVLPDFWDVFMGRNRTLPLDTY